jgi:predicted DNA-binding ribbon-helix-helix protein
VSQLIRRNVRIENRRTSVKMEREMWEALNEICERSGRSIHDVCAEVRRAGDGANFTSLLRVYILNCYRQVARTGDSAASALTSTD